MWISNKGGFRSCGVLCLLDGGDTIGNSFVMKGILFSMHRSSVHSPVSATGSVQTIHATVLAIKKKKKSEVP